MPGTDSKAGLAPVATIIFAALTGYFADEGISVVSGITYERIAQAGGAVKLDVQGQAGPMTISAERVMIATGRTPNTGRLNLPAAGIFAP